MSLFVLLGCSVTTLRYKDGQISLSFNNKQSVIRGETLSNTFENFGSLYLQQESMQVPQGNIVVYEHVRLDSSYEFNFMTTRTIELLFETQRISKIYVDKGLYCYQLVLRDGQVLNAVVEQYADQSMSLIYGMSTPQMKQILKKIDQNPSKVLFENVMIFHNPKEAIKSKWSSKKVHFAPLIVPLRMIFGL